MTDEQTPLSAPETRELQEAPPSAPPLREPELGAVDVRAAVPQPFSRLSLREAARRTASALALLCLDLGGLTLGVYVSLVAREVWVGNTPVLWGAIWQVLADVLPFLALVTVLVFWRAGLYGRREVRSGFTRVPGPDREGKRQEANHDDRRGRTAGRWRTGATGSFRSWVTIEAASGTSSSARSDPATEAGRSARSVPSASFAVFSTRKTSPS